jgi:chromate reductase, NAD(P)H dehydrogenase (quinone)
MKDILLFAGSNNPRSINQLLVTSVAGLINTGNHKIINLRDFPLPLYSVELQQQGIPQQAIDLKKIVDDYPFLVITVAEHNGSISAFFKNVLDWLSRVGQDYRVFKNKQVVLLSASPGDGGASAISHAEFILKRLGATITGKIQVNNFYQRTYITENGLQFKDANLFNEITAIIGSISS